MWDDIEKVRKMMKNREVKKKPGYSWIEVNKQVYALASEEKPIPHIEEIYAELDGFLGMMKEVGYTPDTRFELNDMRRSIRNIIFTFIVKIWQLHLVSSIHPLGFLSESLRTLEYVVIATLLSNSSPIFMYEKL